MLKVSKSQKQIMASWILPTIECWGNFQYIKLPQRSYFGRIQDNICFEIFWPLVLSVLIMQDGKAFLHLLWMKLQYWNYTQYVGRKLLYNSKGQANIYLVKVAPNVNIVKQDYLIKNESSFPARVGEEEIWISELILSFNGMLW